MCLRREEQRETQRDSVCVCERDRHREAMCVFEERGTEIDTERQCVCEREIDIERQCVCLRREGQR